jgi:hypothetical protein
MLIGRRALNLPFDRLEDFGGRWAGPGRPELAGAVRHPHAGTR